MRRVLWFLPLIFLGGCAQQATRPDADFVGSGLKNMARAMVAGRAVDEALLARRRDDAAAFAGAVERLRRSGVPDMAALASALMVSEAEDAVALAVYFDSMARQQNDAIRETWQQRAATYYRRALQIAPDFPSRNRLYLNAVGYFLAERGQSMEDFRLAEDLTRRSLQQWDRALKELPKNDPRLGFMRFERALTAHDSYAWALYRQGRFEEALREQTEVLATTKATASSVPFGPGDSLTELYYHLGKIHLALGQSEEARAAFEETLKIKPTHEEAQKALEQIESGKIVRAMYKAKT